MMTRKRGNQNLIIDDPFAKGAQVEVSIEEEGFYGSWYTATVLRPPNSTNKKKIFVEFHTLTATSSAAQPLREFVNVILVLPIPPRESCRRFHVSKEVDAFHNDGWWEGIVIAVVDGGDHYSMFFRSSKEQIDFEESQLRLHRDWVYGEWILPLKEDDDVKN